MANKLSQGQIEKIVQEFFGVHPKYFVYGGITIQVDISRFEQEEKKKFIGWCDGKVPRAKILNKSS